MASKKASASAPVRCRMASASAGEVSGPVATMTLSQSGGGKPAISSRAIVDQRMGVERRGDRGGKSVAIDGERAACRHLIGVGRAHHQRVEPAHLLVQQADRVVLAIVGAERVGADEFREVARSCARRSRAPAASHAGPPARRATRSARRLPSRRGRRRQYAPLATDSNSCDQAISIADATTRPLRWDRSC